MHRAPVVTLALLLVSLCTSLAGGPVSEHGRLRVEKGRIVDQAGRPTSLAGVSFGWSQWEGSHYFNADAVRWLRDDWHASIVRAPLGIAKDGYLAHPAANRERVTAVVDAAIAADIYVIIDWHDHHAHQHAELAIEFFAAMARRYHGNPHVIYEIYNEPLRDASWSKDVKPYAERIIAAIRAHDPAGLIVVGTPNWSQDVDVAATDPLTDTNVAYTLHFYAATHKQWLRDKALVALQRGLALFVTEWGTCAANGDGKIDHAEIDAWLTFMREHGLSHCNWNISHKNETSSILRPGAAFTGQWQDSDLTPSGQLVRDIVRSWPQ